MPLNQRLALTWPRATRPRTVDDSYISVFVTLNVLARFCFNMHLVSKFNYLTVGRLQITLAFVLIVMLKNAQLIRIFFVVSFFYSLGNWFLNVILIDR